MTRTFWAAILLVYGLGVGASVIVPSAWADPVSEAPHQKEPAPPVPVAGIPIPEIAQRAEQAAVLLRTAEQVPSDSDVNDIEAQLPNAGEWIRAHAATTAQVLASSPSGNALANLGDSWRVMRRTLAAWSETLTRRATVLDQGVKQLDAMRATWSATRTQAFDSGAPTSVLERVDDTLTAIAAARGRAGDRLAHVLVLQDHVVKSLTRCDEALSRIAQAGDALAGPFLSRDGFPVWSREARRELSADSGERLRDSFRDAAELTRELLHAQRARLALQIALVVLGVVLARRARVASRRRADKEPSEAAAAQVFEVPISCALIVALLPSGWIYAEPPNALSNTVGLLVLPPVVRVMRRLASPAVVPAVYALAAFFVIDRVRAVSSVVPVLEQWIFLAEMASGVVFLALAARSEHFLAGAAGAPERPWQRATAWLLWSQVCLLLGAVVASACGYMRLARLLGGAPLTSDYVALVLYAGLRVADGLVVYGLHTDPLRRLFAVQRHQALLHRRVTRALSWFAVGIWGYFTMDAFGLTTPIWSAAMAALNARYVRGSVSLSLGDVVAFVVTVIAAFAVSAFVRFVLQQDVYPRAGLPRGVPYTASVLLHYLIILLGFMFAIAAMGVDLTRITILAGAFGVGVGLGLQSAVANFVAGLILLLERRIQVGDSIQLGDLQGQVREIGSRASTIRTGHGAEVIVPNSTLTSERVTNWTLSDRLRRVDLAVRVAYASDPEQVLEILRAAGKANPKALADPAPDAVCTGFADAALNFQLRVWTARAEEGEAVLSQLAVAVHRALTAAKIDIPVPQREVQLRPDTWITKS
jgi:potassium-dependent mechanosensitive channel